MGKHTPGPWNWDGDVTDYDHDQEAPWLISGTDSILTGEIEATNRADVALIAAAPDLLEALELIEKETCSIPLTIWAVRNAAISKARGRT